MYRSSVCLSHLTCLTNAVCFEKICWFDANGNVVHPSAHTHTTFFVGIRWCGCGRGKKRERKRVDLVWFDCETPTVTGRMCVTSAKCNKK